MAGVLGGKGTAETAADFTVACLGQIKAIDAAQKLARLFACACLAQAGAGIVIGDGGIQTGGNVGHAALFDQITCEFKGAAGQIYGACLIRRAFKQVGIMFDHHARTGT